MSSCQEEITRNSPSFQGLKDDVMWRAIDSRAELETNGSLTIIGLTQYEIVTLKVPSTNEATYILGTSTNKQAAYVYEKDDVVLNYSTGIGMGDGQIIIEEYDEAKMTITGSFRFNAENVDDNPLGGEILNYREGVFYKVPVIPAL